MESKEAVRERLKAFTTYVDVIAGALAACKRTDFSADSAKWSKALLEVCQQFSKNIPELGDIFFEERPPFPSMSSQASELLQILNKGEELEVVFGLATLIRISALHKERIREAVGSRLDKYGELIPKITEILEEELQP